LKNTSLESLEKGPEWRRFKLPDSDIVLLDLEPGGVYRQGGPGMVLQLKGESEFYFGSACFKLEEKDSLKILKGEYLIHNPGEKHSLLLFKKF